MTIDEFILPVSTSQEIKSFILLDGYSFAAPSGRWEVEFDNDYSISNSMRPPPVPELNEDAGIATVDPLDLLVNNDRIDDNKEAKSHDVDVVKSNSKEDEDEQQEPISPRAPLSQLDDIIATSPRSPIQSENYNEEPTQQIPQVQNLAQLRHVTSTEPESASIRQRNQTISSKLETETIANSDSDVQTPSMDLKHSTPISSGNQGGLQDGIDGVEVFPVGSNSAMPTQTVADSDGAASDDKTTASDTESEDEANLGDKSSTAAETTQRVKHKQCKAKQFTSNQRKRDCESPVATQVRPTKRRRVVPVNLATPAEDESETASSPQKKCERREKLSEVGSSASEPAPTQNVSTQRKVRRRVKLTFTDHEVVDARHDNSDNVTGLTDDTAAGTPRRTRSASVDSRPRPLSSKPKIVLSTSLSNTDKYETTLKSFGATFVKDVIEADVFCVPNGDLKKTLNLVLSLIYGKFIVTEAWLKECTRTKKFGDPMNYLPDTQSHDWSLTESLERGRSKTTIRMLDSWSVFITIALEKELGPLRVKEQGKIARAMGANFRVRLPTQRAVNNVLVLGTKDDPYVNTVQRLGHSLFQREILTMAALRGTLDMDSDEFKVQPMIKMEDSD